MTPERMLELLSEAGQDSSSTYDDVENGWFGWNLSNVPGVNQKDRGILTIRFVPAEQDAAGEAVTRRFWVMPA